MRALLIRWLLIIAATLCSAGPAAAQSWTECAGEGGTCSVPGTANVRYGANGAYVYKTVTGSIACNNATWGDPAPTLYKTCAYSSSTAASSWTIVAYEYQSFSVSGTQTVRYGRDGAWVQRDVSGSGQCNNAFFGSDPAPYQAKRCEAGGSAAATAASGWTLIASEYQSFSVSGTRTVRYGRDGAWVQRSVSGSGQCSNAFFGSDPAPYQAKRCEVASDGTAAATSGWTRCANEGGMCSVPTARNVRYGANGVYVTRWVTGSVACNNATWGDPVPTVGKVCEYENTPTASALSAPATGVTGPQPYATSAPTTVVGNGSAGSCTESTLRSAVAGGGTIVFNCGGGVVTIPITQTLNAPTDRDTVIDGGDRIVLDGGGSTQILRAFRSDFRVNDRVLAVQRLTMRNGRDVGINYVPRNGGSSCAWGYKEGGGGAIMTRDVNLFVWGVTFEGNRGPDVGPDVAGGAIYVFGAKKITVNNSVFRNNSASNGGAIGLLHVSAEMHNTVFESNRATGMLANFANASGCPFFNHAAQGGAGGLGGAFYTDGFNTDDYLSRVRMSDNSANDLGGAVFRSAYWGIGWGKQTITWEDAVFERNRTTAAGGGAAYVNNSLFTVRRSRFDANDAGSGDGGALKITGATIQFSDSSFNGNRATTNGGGIAHWSGGPEGVGSSARVTFSGNAPNDTAGIFPR